MLYGRMGYICALLFVNKNFGVEKIPQSHIQQVPRFCAFWSLFRIPPTICLNYWFCFPGWHIPGSWKVRCILTSEGQAWSEKQQLHLECCWKLYREWLGLRSPAAPFESLEAIQRKIRGRFHLQGAGVPLVSEGALLSFDRWILVSCSRKSSKSSRLSLF